MSNLKFFHFGVQCPHNSHLISLIQRVSKSTGASASIYDISNREDICLKYNEGKCVGGAEFLPSGLIPYPIPGKGERTAFLTCLFSSDENKDYKSYPLQALTAHLRGRGFKSLLAIASEDVVFPNGPLWWFLAKGFMDRGEVFYEPQDQARMHLVEMALD